MWPFKKKKTVVEIKELDQLEIWAAEYDVTLVDGTACKAYRRQYTSMSFGEYYTEWRLHIDIKAGALSGRLYEKHIITSHLVDEFTRVNKSRPKYEIAYSDGSTEEIVCGT